MPRTKQERSAANLAADKRRRNEFRRQLAEIESANITREEYAKREARIRKAMHKANLDLIQEL
jgi:hypothetical protein